MYTQCPDCGTAFRVTAEVLKQAAGQALCGGCGNNFNAVEYLSEERPERIAAQDREAPLDELAGSDIRIEDTGVEWRVLDDNEASQAEADNVPLDVASLDDTAVGGFFEESASAFEELRFDDDTPLPEHFDPEDESSLEPEAPDSDRSAAPAETGSGFEHEPADISLSEPGEWTDILDEFDEPSSAAGAPLDVTHATLDNGPDEKHGESAAAAGDDLGDADALLDVDAQFALQAEAMGIDLSGMHQKPDYDKEEAKRDMPGATPTPDLDGQEGSEEGEDQAPLVFGSIDPATAELEDQADVFDRTIVEPAEAAELEIDEGLLSFAVEDEDGHASTITMPQKGAEAITIAQKETEPTEKGGSAGFETIVMEGEFVRSALDDGKHEADMAAATLLADQARASRNAETSVRTSGGRHGMTIAVVGLVALLLLQLVHQSRETLATIPALHSAISPVYQAIGIPLAPAWDVTGWRFEATKDISEENNEQLTFYSRIGNTSDKSLPYPSISISLTDRFEDTIGSRILSPADYLTDDVDSGKLVAPGSTFNAVISVRSPATDAMGYKLKACYRMSNGQLRCKAPDFK